MKNNYSDTQNGINLDYDYNSEYGDGDIPNIDKNSTKNIYSKGTAYSSKNIYSKGTKNVIPDEVPRKDAPGGEEG